MPDPVTSLLLDDREMIPCPNISSWPPPPDDIFLDLEPRKAISLYSRLNVTECIELFEAASTRQDVDTLELSCSYKCLKSTIVKHALTTLLQQDPKWRVILKLHGRAQDDIEVISHLRPVHYLVLTQCPNLTDDYFEQVFSELRSFPNLRILKLQMWSRRPAHHTLLQHAQSMKDRVVIPSLFSWLSSSSCRLHSFTFGATFAHSVGFYQRLFAAIGQNRSIRRLELLALNSQLNLPEDLCPHLATSSVETVYLKFSRSEWRCDYKAINMLLVSWMIMFRSKRLLTLQFPKARRSYLYRRAEYVSSIHKRWRRGQSTIGGMSFLADIPPILWSMELERMSEGWNNADVPGARIQPLALDTSFYLLTLWLSGISQVPGRHPARQKRRGSLCYRSDSDDDNSESGFVGISLWGKKFRKIN